MQNDFFSKTSFLSDFSWISRNFRKFASILKAFRQKTQLWIKKTDGKPPSNIFFCTKQTKSLLDALQITRNHLHFFEIKKVCQSKNAWGKCCYFVAKNFPQEGCVCFRKLILRHFRTHLDQNPVQSTLFRSFWCPTD